MIRALMTLIVLVFSVLQMKPQAYSLSENVSELPEVIVESRRHLVLHILAYVRECSSLTTYDDTVFLFREKMVDYMLPSDKKVKFKDGQPPEY